MSFKILNFEEIPRSLNSVKWREIKPGFIFKTNHKKYGYIEFELSEYKEGYLYFKNFNKKIKISHFLSGNIGGIINNKITKKFKYNIGYNLKDNKRNIVITSREYRDGEKYYKYTCNKCGWTEGCIGEYNLNSGQGCSSCRGLTVTSMNNIWNNQRWMCDLGLSEEDAKTHTKGSHDRVEVICPNCGNKKEIIIYNLYINKTIGCKQCGDGIPYTEKIMIGVLNQLMTTFQTQLTKANFNWCNKCKYDFYLPDYNMIIETHGEQHYRDDTGFSRTLEQEQENDRIKKELALNNGIDKYIVIDCRYSKLEWIKNSILNSELSNIFDLSKIDWLKCEEFALKNIVKEVCDYWNNKEDWETTNTIANNNPWGIKSGATIRKYVKIGDRLGWTIYDIKKEKDKAYKKAKEILITRCSKKVEVFRDGISLGVFKSGCELERQSEEMFGTKLFQANISSVCRGESKCYKGFVFKYL